MIFASCDSGRTSATTPAELLAEPVLVRRPEGHTLAVARVGGIGRDDVPDERPELGEELALALFA